MKSNEPQHRSQNKAQHISNQQLELLVNEQLDSDQESRLISHIDQCEDCQTRLEKLVENGSEWSSIHQHLVEVDEIETPGESSIRKFMELLGPTDDPGFLGRLGGYEVSAVIGSGSTGIVAKAHERALNRFVAIKVLHPKLCDSGAARKRFDREGRAIAAVVNPPCRTRVCDQRTRWSSVYRNAVHAWRIIATKNHP